MVMITALNYRHTDTVDVHVKNDGLVHVTQKILPDAASTWMTLCAAWDGWCTGVFVEPTNKAPTCLRCLRCLGQ